MREIHHKHTLANGRSLWIQRVKIPGLRQPKWSVVLSGLGRWDAPEITEVSSLESGLQVLSDLLAEDVTG